MQCLVRGIKEPPEVAGRLTDALLVLDQSDAHIAVAVLAKPDPRRDGNIGLLDQQLENSSEPRALKRSGTGAQANIEALGAGIAHPARPNESTRASRRRL